MESNIRAWLSPLIIVAVIIVIGLTALGLMAQSLPPSALEQFVHQRILIRYMDEWGQGYGLTFNPDAPLLLKPEPLYLLLESVFPYLAEAVSILVGTVTLAWLARRAGLAIIPSMITGGLFTLLVGLGGAASGVPLMTALSLLAVALLLERRILLAALTIGLACFAQPWALIPWLVLSAWAFIQGHGLRFLVASLAVLALGALVLWIYYGPNFWYSFTTLSRGAVNWLPFIPLGIWLILAIWGWYRQRQQPVVRLAALWIVLHVLVAVLLYGFSIQHFVPILPLVALLGMIGLMQRWPDLELVGLVGGTVLGLAIAMFILRTMSSVLYVPTIVEDMAEPLALPDLTALAEIYPAPQQVIVNLDGSLQPDYRLALDRNDKQSALIRYVPSIQALLDQEQNDLIDTPALKLLYSNIAKFFRAPFTELASISAPLTFGPQITLERAAVDTIQMRPEQLVRVRLGWRIARDADKPVKIVFKLVDRDTQQVLMTSEDVMDAAVFRQGQYSTYHVFQVPPDAQPIIVQLKVSLWIEDGMVAEHLLDEWSILDSPNPLIQQNKF